MKLRPLISIAASLALFATPSFGGSRPHYGGSLRVQSRDVVTSIEGVWTSPNSVLRQQLSSLLFDQLTKIDGTGAPMHSLATSWSSDPQQRVWTFQLRKDATFANGSSVAAVDVVTAISKAAPQWKVTAQGDAVVIETEVSTPHLPVLLALPEFSIVKKDVDGTILGSGPFRIDTFQAARRIVLSANDDYWGGRPYLDKVEITMGGSVREELVNRRLDLDDVAELSLDQARTIGYGTQSAAARLLATRPSDLYALVFFRAPATDTSTPATTPRVDDPRIREAIALTIDKTSINRVLLQKQAEAAPSLLPQWLSGYSFLFTDNIDVERARKLRSDGFKTAPASLLVAYDSNDNIARAIAERVAVNAREANITVQTFGEKNLSMDSVATSGASAIIVRLPIASMAPAAALADLAIRTGMSPQAIAQAESVSGPESAMTAEKSLLQGFRVVPIVHVPEIIWLGSRVHDWSSWRLQDVWLETDRPSATPAAQLPFTLR